MLLAVPVAILSFDQFCFSAGSPMLRRVKALLGEQRSYLVRIQHLPTDNISELTEPLSVFMTKLELDGVAILDQHIPSTHLSILKSKLRVILTWRDCWRHPPTFVLFFTGFPEISAVQLFNCHRTRDFWFLREASWGGRPHDTISRVRSICGA